MVWLCPAFFAAVAVDDGRIFRTIWSKAVAAGSESEEKKVKEKESRKREHENECRKGKKKMSREIRRVPSPFSDSHIFRYVVLSTSP